MNKSFFKFLILCSGGFVASIGHGITSFGLSVYVFEQTGRASSTALIALYFNPAISNKIRKKIGGTIRCTVK